MKIEAVEVLGVGWELTGEQTFVRLTTDSGITGLGQSGCWGYPKGVAGVLEELKQLLIGADPFRIEHLWHLAYRARPFRGNLLSAAVSAIDLALWDIKGKALEQPVWELLGGRTRNRVRLHVLVGGGTPDEIVSSVNWAVEEGFTAVKFDPLAHGYEDLSMVQLVNLVCSMAAAAREAGGDEIDLIFELHRKLDPAKAIVVCNALAQFHPLFIEDPIQIDSIETQANIARRSSVPIAMGERLRSGSSTSSSLAMPRFSCGPTSASPAAFPAAARSPRSPRHTTAGSRRTTSWARGTQRRPCSCARPSRTW